jgi:RNA polymerase sigma-70 factor (ECF subfamily)
VSEHQGNPEQMRTDMQLVRRCLAGEQGAFVEIVEAYQNMVYNLAYRFLGDSGEAEDLAQEVFLKVYRSLKSFKGLSTLKTWIYRIASNMSLNRIKYLQRRKKNSQVQLEGDANSEGLAPIDTLSDAAPGPEKEMHGRDINLRLQQALLNLSPEQQAVVILRDIEGLTYEEISVALDVNLGTVKSRLARGRMNIQEQMRDLL